MGDDSETGNDDKRGERPYGLEHDSSWLVLIECRRILSGPVRSSLSGQTTRHHDGTDRSDFGRRPIGGARTLRLTPDDGRRFAAAGGGGAHRVEKRRDTVR